MVFKSYSLFLTIYIIYQQNMTHNTVTQQFVMCGSIYILLGSLIVDGELPGESHVSHVLLELVGWSEALHASHQLCMLPLAKVKSH